MAQLTSLTANHLPLIPAGVSLIPVVEIRPYMAITSGAEQASLTEDGDALCLAATDGTVLVTLYPIEPGWGHIPIDQLNHHAALGLLVGTRLADDDEPEDDGGNTAGPHLDPDNILPFDGGFALCIDGKVTFAPRCCSDLGNLDAWQSAAEHRSDDKKMVWIGHPWIDVRFDGQHLHFSESEDKTKAVEPEADCNVVPSDLKAAIERARSELEVLAQRLCPVIEPLAPLGRTLETARILAGL